MFSRALDYSWFLPSCWVVRGIANPILLGYEKGVANVPHNVMINEFFACEQGGVTAGADVVTEICSLARVLLKRRRLGLQISRN